MPNSLTTIVPLTPWASNPGAPVLVLGTAYKDLFLFYFHGIEALTKYHISDTVHNFNLLLIIAILQRLELFKSVNKLNV